MLRHTTTAALLLTMCSPENVTLNSIFTSQTHTSVRMSVTCLRAQLAETQQREQGPTVTSARLPPVVPVDLLPLHAVIVRGIGHLHLGSASSRLTVLRFKNSVSRGTEINISRSRVQTEPTTVQPVHSRFLQRSRRLVWFEEHLLSKRCDLVIEHLASDALMSCHAVTANMERRQGPCSMSHNPFQN